MKTRKEAMTAALNMLYDIAVDTTKSVGDRLVAIQMLIDFSKTRGASEKTT